MDLIVVPSDPRLAVEQGRVVDLFDRWQDAGMLAAGTGPLRRKAGVRAWALVPGGFGVVWLDRPAGVTLYANQLGGFRVPCPACGAPLARAFGQAVQALRASAVPSPVTCTGCGHPAPLFELPLYPPGAFARGAVVFGDARALQPAVQVLGELSDILGEVRVILRRRS